MLKPLPMAMAVCLLLGAAPLLAEDEPAAPPASAPAKPAPPAPRVHGPGHKFLWYLPNRLLDLVDMFRLRVRTGPGLAAEARVTMYAANFIGQYDALYAGLPGPRRQPVLPRLAGREQWKGLLVMGVDATDDAPHPPRYSDSEVSAGVQLLLLGLDAGVDPIEIADFLTGWLMIDIAGDDL